MARKTLGIIGFGAFGQFLARHLVQHFAIFVHDTRDISTAARNIGVHSCTLRDAAAKDVVIMAVPVQEFEKCIKDVRNYVTPGALVIDVSSVKIKPVQLMKRYLPRDVEIIATHPLFGPQSGKNGIAGLRIVLCNVRSTRFEAVKSYCEGLGLITLVRTPQEHDREMAHVLGVTHFIARALNEMRIPRGEQRTRAYEHLMETMQLLQHDSFDLFVTLENENPYAKPARTRFLKKLLKLEKKLESKKNALR
jgi:prephenate dehydrogenase